MNLQQPITKKPWNEQINYLSVVSELKSEESMKKAAAELHDRDETPVDENIECAVSVDGTWQRRGHASLHAVVSLISIDNGKVLDVESKSKTCKACNYWNTKDKDSLEYCKWKSEHALVCGVDYEGSAGGMEPAAATAMFSRSVESRNLMYTSCISDGDSKTFATITNMDPYNEFNKVVTKKECVGHVQKRVGSRLRTMKSKLGRQKLKDNKPFGGKGRMTFKLINKLQNYYGLAIRSNKGNLQEMEKAVNASLKHCASSAQNPMHDDCPKGEDSWCGWQRDQASGEEKYKDKGGIPEAVFEKVEEVFKDLSKPELLSRCLEGLTQNQNESFNGLLWSICPKEVFVGSATLRLSLGMAVLMFNEGLGGIGKIMDACGCPVSASNKAILRKMDEQNIRDAERQASSAVKKIRKKRRAKRKGFQDKTLESEGVTYGPGMF